MFLMNGDRKVLQFDIDDCYMEVLDNDFLPYELKDYVKTSDFSSREAMKKSMKDLDVLRDFLSGRMLNLSRDHAKAILKVLALPQSLKTGERLKIVLDCQALSMTDNFWVKKDDSTTVFSEVNLRNHKLGDAAYEISVLGKFISVTKDVMQPDIGTDGMFAKTWVRTEEGIELWKSDRTAGNVNTVAEVQASKLLDFTNVSHVHYEMFERGGRKIAKSTCLANDEISIMNALTLQDWCEHTDQSMLDLLEHRFLENFSKMCVIDYIIANTDRHLGNIHFLVDNKSNRIVSMAPLFDHNQALLADEFDTDISDLVYDITGLSMKETALKYYPYANLQIDETRFPSKCRERLSAVLYNFES